MSDLGKKNKGFKVLLGYCHHNANDRLGGRVNATLS